LFFDPRPKEKREDLFDRERELERFSDALAYSPLILILGARRMGKTSLMNVALKESRQPYVIIDLRGLPYNPSRADLLRRFETGFKKASKNWRSSLLDALSKVNGISVLGSSISFSWGKNRVDLAELFDTVDEWALKAGVKFLVAFDELQIVRGEREFPRLFAHVADTNRNVVLVVSGSEVGVLFDFLKFDNPSSPLYGRHYSDITLNKFSKMESTEFLRRGFEQLGLRVQEDVLEYAVEQLDGVIGWLTRFGARCCELKSCTKSVVDNVAYEGGQLAREEVASLPARSKRYATILNHLAKVENAHWNEIKRILEAREGHTITNTAFTQVLSNLVKMGFIEKKEDTYTIYDPLLKRGVLEHPLPE
jgi:AAA+ ATPase superfamily predicted ATPase